MVPLAVAFRDRSHEVAWAAPAEVCGRISDEGFEALPAGIGELEGLAEFDRRFPEIKELPPAERPEVMFSRVFGAVRAAPMLRDLWPLAQAWKPSLLVCDQAELAGPVVAAALGLPNVTHSFGHLLPARRVTRATEFVAPIWEEFGLQARPFAGAYDHLYLDIYPPSLQTAERDHVPAIQPLRPVTFAAAGDEPAPDWLTEALDRPVVYVTFGTVFNREVAVIATVVAAIRELPVSVVVTVGPGRDPEALGEQPSNVHVARYIPQTALLPHCSAVVSHAGSGTFLAALTAGLPQLLLPQAADQFLNAAAGFRAGAAIAIPPEDLSEDTVRTAMSRLLDDPGYRLASQRISAEIASMPGPDDVMKAIERRFLT